MLREHNNRRVRRCLSALLAATLALSSHAAEAADVNSSAYKIAERAFLTMPISSRVELQQLLAVTGHSVAVSNEEYGPRLFDAIARFQGENGFGKDGVLSPSELTTLRSLAAPTLRLWKLSPVRDRATGIPLWVPFGYGLKTERSAFGVRLTSRIANVIFIQDANINLADMYEIMTKRFEDHFVDYKLLKDDFFVLTTHTTKIKTYTRYQFLDSGAIGFTLFYSPTDPTGDRLATVMSDLFRASTSLGRNWSPPIATGGEPDEHEPDDEPEPVTVARADPKPSRPGVGSGTGFFIAPRRLMTNAHVVEGCSKVDVFIGTQTTPGAVVARDTTNDLALVETKMASVSFAKLGSDPARGEKVYAFGFPLFGTLASSGNFTDGMVSAAAGQRDDTSQLQHSAPIQPGNSGGPLLNESGDVIGVNVSKLQSYGRGEQFGLTQNTNFAIKASTATTFLSSTDTKFARGESGPELKPKDIAALASAFSGRVECRPTN